MQASILFVVFAVTMSVPTKAQEAEYSVAGGRFFTQTGGDTPEPGDGFAVVDDSEARFWTAFVEYGGVAGVGFPVSRRFIWDGFVTQVMQKAVFQWRPGEQATAFVNVFDDLHRLGYDQQLADKLVPRHEEFEESHLDWPQILEQRIALLDEEPALRRVYLASGDPLRHFGLPTSQVRNYAGVSAIRLQRAVLQFWQEDFPWAPAGTVTIANGGDLAKQLGMFPRAALTPHAGNVIPATLPITDPGPDYEKVIRDALAAASQADSFHFREIHNRTPNFRNSSGPDFSASGTVQSPDMLHKQVHAANHIDPRCLIDPVPCDVARSFEYLSRDGAEYLRVSATDPWVSAVSEDVRPDLLGFLRGGYVSDHPLEIAETALDRIKWSGRYEPVVELITVNGVELERIQIATTHCGGAATFRNEVTARIRVSDSLLDSISFTSRAISGCCSDPCPAVLIPSGKSTFFLGFDYSPVDDAVFSLEN
ncbi:MAG: hypothetical protein OXG77_06235 [Chloroflexi bacterium]|nr:hypothetical protein [Chloroflexota bacterium]